MTDQNDTPATAIWRPIIRVDFNVPRRPMPGNGGFWLFTPRQEVVLDDGEGLRARGRFSHWLGPTEHAPDNRLAFFDIDEDSYEHYEVGS